MAGAARHVAAMLRALARVLALVAFALAVLAGLVDAARTVAADSAVLTPMIDGLGQIAPGLLDRVRTGAAAVPGLGGLVEALLGLPAWVVFGALALLFWLAGRPALPRHRRYVRS